MRTRLSIVNGRTVDQYGRRFEPDLAAIERKRRYNEKYSRHGHVALSTRQAIACHVVR